MQYFVHTNFVVGSTEEEARRKDEEALDYLSSETNLAFMSSTMGTDLAEIELDAPVGDFDTNAVKGAIKALAEAAPDKSWTFREVVVALIRNRIVGGPEQIADQLTEWRDAGVTGVNVGSITGAWDINDFADYVAPVLQARGLMQREYAPGTFREKMFADTPSANGPRLNERHPAASFRQHAAA
jgi:alkanesulfonate monooxygenase SsuD/methylene tetrahydromethanopterin reductase-like flavin-dependent oxidoreductase (luciferase family)